jgi:hypothetical protein
MLQVMRTGALSGQGKSSLFQAPAMTDSKSILKTHNVCRLKPAIASLALAARLSPCVSAPSCCRRCATADANLHKKHNTQRTQCHIRQAV